MVAREPVKLDNAPVARMIREASTC
jgi:hypothetical protein